MAGLVKAKKYDWKDSNLAMFGSDTEKQVKKESADAEPAWDCAGEEVGVQIWRINQFKVEDVPKEEYGSFFSGDSYIILNTYKEEDTDALLYDVHFWIGQYSTQDEYGTAAYKTVELDTKLDDKAVQHRETQGHESSLFKSYFKTVTTVKGGHATGFRHVVPEEYTPRLLRFKDKTVDEVPRLKLYVQGHPDDVYVLDKGEELLRYNGGGSLKEKTQCTEFLDELISSRSMGSVNVVESEYELLKELDDDELEEEDEEEDCCDEIVLVKISDDDGSLDLEEVKRGDVKAEDLVSDDIFIIHCKSEILVWVGCNASTNEKKNGLFYVDKYVRKLGKGSLLPVSIFSEGGSSTECRVMAALTA